MIQTNKQKYIEFSKQEKNIPIFSQSWWLDSVCGTDNWDVCLIEKGGKIVASMPYYKTKKFMLNMIFMPKLTQTMGPYILYPKGQKYYKKLSWDKDIINKLLRQLPKYDYFFQNLHYSITNWLPFYWNGYKQTIRYTYIIENITVEDLEKKFETDIRRRRRKATNIGVEVYESDDIKKFYELNEMTFIRQGKEMPYSFKFIESLYNNCKENNACKIFFAKDKDGIIIAGNFLIYDKNTVYYLMGGINPKYKDLGGMDVVQFESIKFALKSGRKFDFEGSMIESIEKYFRSFGAIQKPYSQITKSRNKFINLLFTLYKG